MGGDFRRNIMAFVTDTRLLNPPGWCRLHDDFAPGGGDGMVDVLELLALLANSGTCPAPCPPSCTGDVNGDCVVDSFDFAALLVNWGMSP
ncbi:MAG: hypothetical protein O7D91_09940 [Planctomycetota bacterium]|nr:hypothetical protein [Planctomycetota bacterium]